MCMWEKVTRLRVKIRIRFVFLAHSSSFGICKEFRRFFIWWFKCVSNTFEWNSQYNCKNLLCNDVTIHKPNVDCVVPKREPNPGTVVGRFDSIGAESPRIKSWFTGFSGQNGFRTCKCLYRKTQFIQKKFFGYIFLSLCPRLLHVTPIFFEEEKKSTFFYFGWLRV